MTQHHVPSCGRHLGKFDDVTIYPVLVVARTDPGVKTIFISNLTLFRKNNEEGRMRHILCTDLYLQIRPRLQPKLDYPESVETPKTIRIIKKNEYFLEIKDKSKLNSTRFRRAGKCVHRRQKKPHACFHLF